MIILRRKVGPQQDSQGVDAGSAGEKNHYAAKKNAGVSTGNAGMSTGNTGMEMKSAKTLGKGLKRTLWALFGITAGLFLIAYCANPEASSNNGGSTALTATIPAPTTASPTATTPEPSESPRPTVEVSETASEPSQAPTQGATADPGAAGGAVIAGSALAALDGLEVKGRAPKTGYSREEFGQRWADVDRNGCDTRNDILKRDLTELTFRAGTRDCVVETGVLADPYTGTRMLFSKSENAASVQIDHVVALMDAWQKGAQGLSAQVRKEFANDPLNLLAVNGVSNQRKSASDAASWLPPSKAFRCQYVARQIAVKAKYRLWVTEAEAEAMRRVLQACPNEALPAAVKPIVQVSGEAGGTPAESVAPNTGTGGTGENGAGGEVSGQPADTPAPGADPSGGAVSGGASGNYANCREVWAAIGRPIMSNEPGYKEKFDGDRDGVGCESRPR